MLFSAAAALSHLALKVFNDTFANHLETFAISSGLRSIRMSLTWKRAFFGNNVSPNNSSRCLIVAVALRGVAPSC